MKINQPGVHLDHMLRQTRMHHAQLSAMADTKASMLLTTSAVIISLSLPHVFSSKPQWPFLVLIFFCFITVVLAAYSAMPKLPANRKDRPPDVHSPKFNLLFFGDFARLDYAQFELAMEEMMNNPSLTYEAQVRELYTLGVFLAAKKYRYLKWAYITFLIGLFVSLGLMLCLNIGS
jgi:Family of unknown function (DUF5706)